jgi:tripartite-type tricarboxylate transporter receptor subunit TctC
MQLRMGVGIVVAGLTAVYGAVPSAAQAQDWPAHPLTMVVPFPAGGGTDVLGRIIGRRLSETLGQPVIIENVTGAGGMIGTARVAKAPPDGYQFDLGSRADAINQTLYKHPLYDLREDLVPVVLIADQPTVLVTRKDFPVGGLRDFIAYTKKNQATMRFGSAGIGSPVFVDCALFDNAIGVQVQHIPYRGGGPAMQDLMAGQLDYTCTLSATAQPQLDAGQIKGIAAFRRERLPSLPQLPTAYEQGTDFEGSTWFGFFLPKGTPPAIVKKLHDATVAAMDDRAVQEQLVATGTFVVAPERRSTSYFEGIIGPEIEKNGGPLKAAGMSID